MYCVFAFLNINKPAEWQLLSSFGRCHFLIISVIKYIAWKSSSLRVLIWESYKSDCLVTSKAINI